LELDPNDAGGYYVRGGILEKMNLLDESIEDFTSALRIDPNHFNAAYARGACENKRGNYLKAIEDYNFAFEKDKCLSASPRRIPLASVNYMLDTNGKEADSAINLSESKSITEGVKAKPLINNEEQIIETSTWKVNESQDISPKWSSLGKTGKSNPEVDKYHALGYEARKKGDYNKAVVMYSKAIELSNGFFKAYFNRGFAFDKLGEYEKAIGDYSRALEIEPKNAFVYYNRGVSLDKLQRYDEAIYNFSMAITLDPTKADFYHNRGFAFRKKLDYEKAIQDYNKAIELNSSHFKVSAFIIYRQTIIKQLTSKKWANSPKLNKAMKMP
jgi:tetratricopeptide (TPR) repeat protein